MPQIDDTVKLKSKFYSWSGDPINCDTGTMVLKIYDYQKTLLETINTGIDNVDVGEYHYDYTVPDGFGFLWHQFICDIGGKQASRKGKVPRTWGDG